MPKLITLAVLLALAAGLVVVGVAQLSTPAAFIAGGVLVAVWACLFLIDVDRGAGP